jgi:uncharacterized protein
MANIFIFHGSYGFPGENWFPWLRAELEKLGHKVYVPAFPTPEGQKLDNWLHVFESYIPKLDGETILVGHSCGAIFALRLLEKIEIKIKAVFLVAGPVKPLNNEFDKVHMDFVDHPINWSKVKDNAKNFYPIYSDNDPYVSIDNGEISARELGTKLIVVKNAGHFNTKAGYDKFKLLLELIKKELPNSSK